MYAPRRYHYSRAENTIRDTDAARSYPNVIAVAQSLAAPAHAPTHNQIITRLSQIQAMYCSILDTGVTENFNDGSWCPRRLWVHNMRVLPEHIDPDDRAIISSGGKSCLQLLWKVIYKFSDCKSVRKSNYLGYFEPVDIAKSLRNCYVTGSNGVSAIITVSLQRLKVAFEVAKLQNDTEYEVELEQLSQQNLLTAVRIEKTTLLLSRSPKQLRVGKHRERHCKFICPIRGSKGIEDAV
jgi:hypothetical protein